MVFQATSLDAKPETLQGREARREKRGHFSMMFTKCLDISKGGLFRIRVTAGYNYTPKKDVSFGTDVKDLKQQDIAEGSSTHSLVKPRKLSGK